MRFTRRQALSGGAALAFTTETNAQPQHQTRVLFVGNSLTYTNNLPRLVSACAATVGVQLETEMAAYPDFGLAEHWDDLRARREIRRGGWDTVVLQQGPSSREDSREMLREYVGRFAPLIVESGARVALFSVWPSRGRAADFPRAEESYELAAADVNGLLLPVAMGWRAAFHLASEVNLYSSDGLHPSRFGSLVAAYVIFGALTARSPAELPDADPVNQTSRVQASVFATLQQAASAALQAHSG
jgi:hypothetical protein